MELSKEQNEAFNKYLEGKNIFITGPGGVGKSAIIKLIYEHSNKNNKNISVTALTGCAAVLLNCKARTIHSWSGIGIGNKTTEQIINKISKNKNLKKSWKTTDILVIDEISMMSLKVFELLDIIGRTIRLNSDPFGGIQLIFSGDFHQLPPIGDKNDPDSIKFCFESSRWNQIFDYDCQIEFKQIFRQKDDIYIDILTQLRNGKMKKKLYEILLTRVNSELKEDLIIEPTKLLPTRNQVETINNNKMSSLNTESKEYNIQFHEDLNDINFLEKKTKLSYGKEDIKNEVEYMMNNILCEKKLTLKVGAQVMCVINMQYEDSNELMLCNGSQGIVIGFCRSTGFPIVKYSNGRIITMKKHVWSSDKIPCVGISQIPLILAWALTIHKSQGSTLDAAEIDVGNKIFECGQTYVALSRVKSLEGLYLSSFDISKIKINQKVKNYYDNLSKFVNNKITIQL